MITLGAVLLGVALLGGCGESQDTWYVMKPGAQRLAPNHILALYASVPSNAQRTLSGHVLLIDAEGQVSSITTAGMDSGSLTWDDNGLFFSDTRRDYLLTEDGLRIWDSPKTDMQVAAYARPGGGYVSVYNKGFGGAGSPMEYVEQVVETTDQGAIGGGNSRHGSTCRDGVILTVTNGQSDAPHVVRWPVDETSAGNGLLRLRSHHLPTGHTSEILTVDLHLAQHDSALVLRGMAIQPARATR